mmetsp:Transcript_1031/g.3618  ORF Transcript_1031/g.3618 Transcript_1031/m.3618 type:complete len:309 (+) Transcript_1031:2708-3634(+)
MSLLICWATLPLTSLASWRRSRGFSSQSLFCRSSAVSWILPFTASSPSMDLSLTMSRRSRDAANRLSGCSTSAFWLIVSFTACRLSLERSLAASSCSRDLASRTSGCSSSALWVTVSFTACKPSLERSRAASRRCRDFPTHSWLDTSSAVAVIVSLTASRPSLDLPSSSSLEASAEARSFCACVPIADSNPPTACFTCSPRCSGGGSSSAGFCSEEAALPLALRALPLSPSLLWLRPLRTGKDSGALHDWEAASRTEAPPLDWSGGSAAPLPLSLPGRVSPLTAAGAAVLGWPPLVSLALLSPIVRTL